MAVVLWKKVRGVCRSSFVYLVLFVFGLSFVYPMLPVSLDYHFLIALRFSLTFIYYQFDMNSI